MSLSKIEFEDNDVKNSYEEGFALTYVLADGDKVGPVNHGEVYHMNKQALRGVVTSLGMSYSLSGGDKARPKTLASIEASKKHMVVKYIDGKGKSESLDMFEDKPHLPHERKDHGKLSDAQKLVVINSLVELWRDNKAEHTIQLGTVPSKEVSLGPLSVTVSFDTVLLKGTVSVHCYVSLGSWSFFAANPFHFHKSVGPASVTVDVIVTTDGVQLAAACSTPFWHDSYGPRVIIPFPKEAATSS